MESFSLQFKFKKKKTKQDFVKCVSSSEDLRGQTNNSPPLPKKTN